MMMFMSEEDTGNNMNRLFHSISGCLFKTTGSYIINTRHHWKLSISVNGERETELHLDKKMVTLKR